MTVKLKEKKTLKLKAACVNLLRKREVTLLELAKVIGIIVASFPGVQYGQLFYRRCDNHKNKVLKENNSVTTLGKLF